MFIVAFLSCSQEEARRSTPVENPYYDYAVEYVEKGKLDSAFIALDQASELFVESKDSLGTAYVFLRIAIALTERNDYFGSQETSLEALRYLNPENERHHVYLSSNYNNLGIATYNLKDFDRALTFYESAITYSSDSSSRLVYLNNIARVYHDKKKFDKAIAIYERILAQTENKREYARVLTNLTLSRWRKNPDQNVAADFLSALHIREQDQDLWGLNSSYSHLADYYVGREPDSALFYAHKCYDVAKVISSADDQIRALERLIRFSPPDSIPRYFKTYTQLTDSVTAARTADKNQFALIRYEVEKNKAENLRLQQENEQRMLQVSRQRILTACIGLLAIVLLVTGSYWYKKRKQRLELEAQNRIKSDRLRTSKKVHDVVANGLYRVMAEVENRHDIDRDGILDRLEEMYEKSRNISYEAEGAADIQMDYHRQLAELITSFATDSTKVLIAGNDPDLWKSVSKEAKYEIHHIIQELMVNMRKHGRATHTVIRFERYASRLAIHYADDGVGLPSDFKKGNGLINTGNRIKNLHGDINFDSGADGLKIRLSFPLN